jgi:intracellular septation protein
MKPLHAMESAMIDVFRKLIADFVSTIVFLIVWAATDNVLVATAVAVGTAIVNVVHARLAGRKLDLMSWASLALVLVLGGATFLTNDPRYVLIKPSIAHFAIGAIMLRRGWMSRYMPPAVLDHAPELPVIAGYAWAILMFTLGAGTIATAMTGDIRLWTLYVSVVAVGAKIVALALQFLVFRIIIGRRLAQRAAAGALATP